MRTRAFHSIEIIKYFDINFKAECLAEVPEEIAMKSHGEVRLQSGTNRYASQKGMTGFG
jgi:hypothetical protein